MKTRTYKQVIGVITDKKINEITDRDKQLTTLKTTAQRRACITFTQTPKHTSVQTCAITDWRVLRDGLKDESDDLTL